MFIISSILSLLTAITIMIFLFSNKMSKKLTMDREKSSPFECGFNPKNSARIPFSLQFFMITLLFLIFDTEITLILPLIMTLKTNNLLTNTIIMTSFILILIIGLIHEWNQGMLNWTI